MADTLTRPAPADVSALARVLEEGAVRLEPLAERHLPALRAACAEDSEIWEIYPVSMLGEAFDASLAHLRGGANVLFAVHHEGRLGGMTGFLRPDGPNRVVEIGATYIAPRLRGMGVNGAMKRLMVGQARACGFHRIELRVDARNARSQAAIRKLGAVHEGTLRAERITWTGHVRDTLVFSLLPGEFRG